MKVHVVVENCVGSHEEIEKFFQDMFPHIDPEEICVITYDGGLNEQ